MTYRVRKRLAILVLVLGLPGYVAVAAVAVSLVERPSPAVEAAIYLGLGIVWALPLRRLFLSLARPDPDSAPPAEEAARRPVSPEDPRSDPARRH